MAFRKGKLTGSSVREEDGVFPYRHLDRFCVAAGSAQIALGYRGEEQNAPLHSSLEVLFGV